MVAPPGLERLTVAAATSAYLTSVANETMRGVLSPTTQRGYERDLREFCALAGPATVLDDVSGPDLDSILVSYQRTVDGRYRDPAAKPGGPGRSPATVNRFRQSISRFLSHAAAHGWVQANPMVWAAPPARLRGGLRVARTALTDEAAQALLVASASGGADRRDQRLAERDRLVVALLVVLGPRVSELVGSDVEDFTASGNELRWRVRGKGGQVRTLVLSPVLVRAFETYVDGLRARLARRGAGPDADRALLLSWRGRRLEAQAVRSLVRRGMARTPARVRRDATPHALRHTTATLLLAAGWDVKVIAELLGHASIATTGAYLDRIDGELAAAIRAHPLSVPDGPELQGTGSGAHLREIVR